jgi:hypothetical protein
MRRWFTSIFAICLATTLIARAGDDTRRAQVSAATADALAVIQRDVMSTSITPKLTVEQFVEKTHSRDAVVKAVHRAEQIGGTRWPDEKTCQVRMELPGAEVADALVDIAKSRPDQAGLPVEVLRERLERMRDTMFGATGMSTCSLERLRPPPEQLAWRGVSDDAIKAALKDARRDAAVQVLNDVAPISKAFADPKLRQPLEDWLVKRPITSADFKDDLEVRVALGVDGESLWDQIVTVADGQKTSELPKDEAVRESLRREIVSRVEPPIGRAIAKAGGAPHTAQPKSVAVDIPREPPAWVAEHVDARGKSPRVDGRLKTARAAENSARDQLRGKVEELPLTRKLTMGEAAQRDDRVRGAIDRAVEGVRPRKISYLSDGGAEVNLSLDLRDVWSELDK